MVVVGSLFANPDLLLDYGELIKPQYDFSEPTPLFWYNSIYELFQIHNNSEINETKINIYMSQDAERKKKYDELKGYKTIQRMISIVDLNDFLTYYESLKKYSLLREYERKGFPAQKIFEKNNFVKLKCEDIVRAMEYQVSTIGTVIGGIQDSVILGKSMTDNVKRWKLKPDVGLPIPFEIINMLMRGARKKKLSLFGMHSGCGKSRTTSKIACFLGIKLRHPVMVAVNEQDEEEWNAMVLSCIINNPEFHTDEDGELNEIGRLVRKYNLFDGIDETNLVTGAYNEKEEELILAAAKYIEERSKIHFLEMAKFDENTLRRQIKRHKLKGCDFLVYDTLKAPDHDWMSFVRTADMLKEMANELAVHIWATFQLTDDSLFEELLTSKAIANGKHIKHVADHLMMARPLFQSDYEKYVVLNPNGLAGEETFKIDYSETRYMVVVDKNRGGKDKDRLCLRVDKGKNRWIEEGYLLLSDDQKELIRIRKEHKKLKQEKEVQRLKQELGKE